MATFEEEYQPQLMSIELAVMSFYADHPQLVDHNVDKVFEALVRVYDKEMKGRKPPKLRIKDLEEELYENVHQLCEFFLGRGSEEDYNIYKSGDSQDEDENKPETVEEEIEMEFLEIQEVINVLKRLRNSISLWGGTYGRTGYLDYVSQFFGEAD